MKLKYLSLFSGCGMFEAAIKEVFPTAECVGFSGELNKGDLKMETQEFFKQWESASPKSFEKFSQFCYLLEFKIFSTNANAYLTNNTKNVIQKNEVGFFFFEGQEVMIRFEMLSGIIHKFFFDNNINSQQIYYNYAITNNFILNQEIEKKAFLKAASIAEGVN